MAEFIYIYCTKSDAISKFNLWKKINNEKYLTLVSNPCELCDSLINCGIHHIDGDKRNNILRNLQVLCTTCHRKLHNTYQIRYLDSFREEFETIKDFIKLTSYEKRRVKDYIFDLNN